MKGVTAKKLMIFVAAVVIAFVVVAWRFYLLDARAKAASEEEGRGLHLVGSAMAPNDEDKDDRPGWYIPRDDDRPKRRYSKPRLHIDYDFGSFHDKDFVKSYREMLEEVERMQKELDRMFEQLNRAPRSRRGFRYRNWPPNFPNPFDATDSRTQTDMGFEFDLQADIEDSGDSYIVRCDIPGMAKEKIDITLEGRTLIVKGEKKAYIKEEDDKGNIIRQERSSGSFLRSFTLPRKVRQDKIKSTYKDGILTIILPKAEPTQKKKPFKIKVDYI